jgi:DNA-binding CsgD family transcriptional regulator
MAFFSEHFRILSALINIILGISIAFIIYHRTIRLPYGYLKYLIRFTILFNSGMVILFIGKYVELNLLDRLPADLLPHLLGFAILCFIVILFGIDYAILQIALGLQGKILIKRVRVLIFTGIAVIAVIYLIENVFFRSLKAVTWIEILFGIAAILEFFILMGIINYGRTCQDKKSQKISLSFGFIFLSRYIFIFALFIILKLLFHGIIPDTVAAFMAFIILIYQNLVPLIWFYFFFLPYAESLSSIVERKSVMVAIYEKYHVSKREQEILRLIVDGKSNVEISQILYISLHTVKNHIYRIYRKFGINTRYELIHLITRFQEKEK